MTVISLDAIVKNILLKRRYSIHYYLDFLIPAKDCLRELSFDLPMQTLRYKVCTLNDNNALELPNDYQDWAGVSYRVGEYLRPLVEDNTLSLVPNYDSNFNIQPYSSGIANDPTNPSFFSIGYQAPYWWSINWNSFGENLGRQFGGITAYNDTFKVNKARNEIKINENLAISEVVLEYIGDGMDADSATHIDAYAQKCIEEYAMYEFYRHNRTYSPSETEMQYQKYVTEKEVLAARFSDLNIDTFRRIVQKNSVAIKY